MAKTNKVAETVIRVMEEGRTAGFRAGENGKIYPTWEKANDAIGVALAPEVIPEVVEIEIALEQESHEIDEG